MSSSVPESVTEASCQAHLPKNALSDVVRNVDRQATATISLASGATGHLDVDLSAPAKYGIVPNYSFKFKVEGDEGSVEMSNFIMPTFLHTITVTLKNGKTRTEKVYKPNDGVGEEWWTTYRYQLEALVDKIRGREPKTWLTKEESVATMEGIEKIYEKNGLGPRPKSSYVFQE
jgi:predicted dehydrogenase